ncbi:HIT family protein [Actinomadura opuntiae]|uniref:HIT family protein n=1 Tax=Actinomadura sp. OS1-43 TaxID=604315 RepID=UPI00255A9E68|nr:HIT family protein [Actinomadura sp. OS1-43]MDL4815612.1 HIT family protein [Actinomadura sp. OS1-43]
MAPTGCLVCDHNASMDSLPPREVVAFDEHWRVAHAFGTATPGWLVLAPRRHVTAIAELTDAEAAALGPWQVRLSRAVHAVTGCRKTYLAQFAETEGFAHVHFHLVPRMADLPTDLRGPRVFALLGRPPEEDLSETRRDELALAVRRHL